ncbi:site-specific integrase [Jannaschia sp. W003]|uniref:site-specific integrase n=1 Tax=Jannaschia sp. W003 TaxID=2867012 RepID=UPI0021A26DEC|nr:site-specific integrase [Jannaschia sp. W003]UWQ20072.1 site-specific integrase [Jannaschia sp. W003]
MLRAHREIAAEALRAPGPRAASAGPHTVRRGRVFHFARRLSAPAEKKLQKKFLRLSLRTDLPVSAMHRALLVRSYAARAERDLVNGQITPNQAKALLGEGARQIIAAMIDEQEAAAGRSDAEIDARIETLKAEAQSLGRAARRNRFDALRPWLDAAARGAGVALPEDLPTELGRQAAQVRRDLLEAEAEVEDGAAVEAACTPVVERFSEATVAVFAQAPVTLSTAIARTYALYPTRSMHGNIKIAGDLLIAWFGDVPVCAIDKEQLLAFLGWAIRLPKTHGKAHGRAHGGAGHVVTKDEEIARADARDAAVIAEISAMDCSDAEKRALLAERLVPRLTFQTIKRYRDSVNRVWKAAADLGATGLAPVPGYAEAERHIEAAMPVDPLHIHKTQPKARQPWSEERLVALFNSPIYRGCASPHRRWKAGPLIIRDALYWVPLIVATLGTRVTEVLELRRDDLIHRNGVYCLRIGATAEKRVKTEDSVRVVPVPQLLLDFGLVEWVRDLADDHGPLLFPEIAARAEKRSLADAFGKIRLQIWRRLGIADHDEDFYALRKTLQTMLEANDVSEGRRQAIAGHRNGKIINRHYTAFHARSLKGDLDKARYELTLVWDAANGFPVIGHCGLSDRIPETAIDVELADEGVAAVTVDTEGERATCRFDHDASPSEIAQAMPKSVRAKVAADAIRLPTRGRKRDLCEAIAAQAKAIDAEPLVARLSRELGEPIAQVRPQSSDGFGTAGRVVISANVGQTVQELPQSVPDLDGATASERTTRAAFEPIASAPSKSVKRAKPLPKKRSRLRNGALEALEPNAEGVRLSVGEGAAVRRTRSSQYRRA